jgi:hypothetical protein
VGPHHLLVAGLVPFMLDKTDKDEGLIILKCATILHVVKLLPGVLAFSYLFQDLHRLLLKSMVQHPVPAGNDLCHDLLFLDGNFMCLSIVASWEVDVFELSTVWKLFPVQYLCLGRVCTRRTFVKFGILNDLRTNTRLLIHSDKKILLCHTRVYEACKKREFAFLCYCFFDFYYETKRVACPQFIV